MSQDQNNGQIDLRLSDRSIADLQKFLKLIGDVEQTAKSTNAVFKTISSQLEKELFGSLQQDLKNLKRLTDSLKRNSIVSNGTGNYLAGEEFRTNQSVRRTSQLGTRAGQDIAMQRELLSLAKQGLQFSTNQVKVEEALNLKLGMRANTIEKINSIEKARSLVQAAEVRQGIEIANGNRSRAQSAQRIHDIAKQRLATLQEEAKAAEKTRKEEEARQRKIKNYSNPGDPELEAAQRQAKMRNLFGDGGATLFGVQAGLMANYMVMNTVQGSISGGVQFTGQLDESLRNLQAITVVTDENLGRLREKILDVSQATKFFATDIADAAVTLGQAGFSSDEIENSIESVALLATATGTDLAKSVDIATSVLGVFNMESSQMSSVADTMTAAVNNSKLNIDKLTLGLQYAGNTAAQSGVSFEELTASLGAMANAGIRSGSTLGTGMRQIMIALQKPSGEFSATLDRLGLTMEDVNLQTNGLYGVMQNLKDGGFTAADAIRSFEVRAAAAFNALAGNLDQVVKLERAFLNSSAAAKANETQMLAVSNQAKRLSANTQALVAIGLEPMSYALRDVMKFAADTMEVLREYPQVLTLIGTGASGVVAGFVAWRVASLGLGLAKLLKDLHGLTAGAGGAAGATRGLQLALVGLSGPLGWIAGGTLLAISAGLLAYTRETRRAARETQQAQTAFDNASGAANRYSSQMDMVAGKITELRHRQAQLDGNSNLLALETQKVREQFREMGITLGDNVTGVDTLIEALSNLQTSLSKKYELQLTTSGGSLATIDQLIAATQGQSSTLRSQIDRTLNKDARARSASEAYSGLGWNTREGLTMARDASGIEDLYQARARVFVDTQGAAADQNRRAQKYLEIIDQMIQAEETRLNLVQQRGDIETDINNTVARNQNMDLVKEVEAFGDRVPLKFQETLRDGGEDAIERYNLGAAAFSDIETTGQELIERLNNAGLPQGLLNDLTNQIQNAIAGTQGTLNNLVEAAQEAAEVRDEAQSILTGIQLSKAERDFASSETGEAARKAFADLQAAKDQEFLNQLEALDTEFVGDKSDPRYAAKYLEIQSNYNNDRTDGQKALNEKLGKILEADAARKENDLKQLEDAVDRAVTREERDGIRFEMEDIIMQIGELRKTAAGLMLEGAVAIQDATREIDAQTAATLEGLAQDSNEDAVAAAERDVEIAERALERVMDLAQTAVTNKQVAEANQAYLTAIGNYAEASAELAEIKTNTGDGTSDANFGDAAFNIDEWTSKLEKAINSANTRVNRKSGGGGSKKDAIDVLIEDLGAKIRAADALISMGEVTNVDFDTVLGKAQEELSKIVSQIQTLDAKLANGNLTVEEQAKLNELVDQEAKLKTFIKQEEMEIARLLLEQGQYQQGILTTVQSWSEQNLNIAETLQNGIVNALNTAKSALTEFFVSWSDGTKKGKDAFRDLAVGVLQSIHQIFAEMMAVYYLQKLLGWLGPIIGGDFGSFLTSYASGMAMGGDVKKAATGTYVDGNLNRDSQRYDLMPGEYVLRRSAVQAIGVDQLDQINAMGNTQVQKANNLNGRGSQATGPAAPREMNLYLVDDRSKAGALGPNDIIAVINDDIARGGSTKKLIKSVQMGAV